jgi:hypothetical protein
MHVATTGLAKNEDNKNEGEDCEPTGYYWPKGLCRLEVGLQVSWQVGTWIDTNIKTTFHHTNSPLLIDN